MAKKKLQGTPNPYDVYEFDFDAKFVYRYPSDWTDKQKRQFARIPAELKRKHSVYGGGVYYYNGEELEIRFVFDTIFEKATPKDPVKDQ